jgi:V/A-type H+/Na+-transporting ATPase subunit I
MSRVRVLGPRARLPEVLSELQDFGELHPISAGVESTGRSAGTGGERTLRRLRRSLSRIEKAIAILPGGSTLPAVDVRSDEPVEPVEWMRTARRSTRRIRELRSHLTQLTEERALLARYGEYFANFEQLARAATRWPRATAYHVVLRKSAAGEIEELRTHLEGLLDGRFELWSQRLDGGDVALLLMLSTDDAGTVEALLGKAGVTEIPLPDVLRQGEPADASQALRRRLETIASEIERVEASIRALAAESLPRLCSAQAWFRDRIAEQQAAGMAGATEHAFVLEGWLPAGSVRSLRDSLESKFGGTIDVEELARESWSGEPAPVVLHNPRLFRPFELLSRIMPSPRYGTIDPTPFVAVFFPMFFGLILGDAGYGVVLGLIALVLHRRSQAGSVKRTIAEIAGPCAAFSIIFGLLFGELFGTLGHEVFGLQPILFDRGHALLPFLGLALAIGTVHILLGLILGVITALRVSGRKALGPGAMLVMVILVIVGILTLAGVLPRSFFTPAVIGVLALFPVLVFAEGVIAPIELLSTLGHILSYARVMALGTASVMMALAANRMVGAVGGVVVGALFALLFHLVNFAIGVFSPTIHALRLHYVEFFGTFFSPGGVRYRPLRHWQSSPGRARG